MKLAAEIEVRLHKKVNPKRFRRALRKNDLHGKVAGKKPLISEKSECSNGIRRKPLRERFGIL